MYVPCARSLASGLAVSASTSNGHAYASATVALGTVTSYDGAAQSGGNSAVDAFIAEELPIALQAALNNIGPDGSAVPGAGAGLVIASPSKKDPDYFYTWTRDSATVLKMIVDEYREGNNDLQKYIDDYVRSQAIIQTVANPSGALLPDGAGLGEAKYNADGSRFNLAWGRPQRDGPALRAVTLIDYSWSLLGQGKSDTVKDIIWPIIQNDLSYTGQYWNNTGFDLWEEVQGSSYFTTQSQYRALVQGAELAAELGVTCSGCEQAPNVLCFSQSFWNGKHIVSNTNLVYQNGRTGIDANSLLSAIHLFDIEAACDDLTLQPCNSKSLASFKVFVDTFRNETLYPINSGISAGSGVALGRYAEDVYFGGNPWYLITLGAAEFLYDAAAAWAKQKRVTIETTSLAFFQEIFPDAQAQSYADDDPTFAAIHAATIAYADSFVAVAQKYTPADGSLSEQFSRTSPGSPVSASALTWSYAAFVTMSQRRAGKFPRSWTPATAGQASDAVSTVCTAGSLAAGVYAPAVAAGAPEVTAESQCTSTVRFALNATTYFGENVFLVGNTSELGSWRAENSQALSSANYTAEAPLWFADVQLAAGQAVSYVYAKLQDCDQGYIFENINRTVVAPACDTTKLATDLQLTQEDDFSGATGTSGGCSS